ncbi:MAG: hypothetical protein LBF68_00380 [Christensenellaceae bacterium]|jgi:3-methyladenine DNA glycosylase AlkD|nr:hypothetical protein [Christensenellaceae bacterium]
MIGQFATFWLANASLLKNLQRCFEFVISLNKGDEFDGSFALILLKCYYVQAEFIDLIFDHINNLNQDFYYKKMGLAWLLSTCYIKFADKTFESLMKNTLDRFTHNIAIRKACESLRVDSDYKVH